MYRLFFLFLLITNICFSQRSDVMQKFYVSSADPQHGAGISLCEFNNQTGEVHLVKEFNNTRSSSYLAVSPDHRFLFTIERRKDEPEGTVTSFQLLDQGNEFEFVNERKVKGLGPCYVSLNESGDILMIANYSQGNTVAFHVNSDGFIGEEASNIYHMGQGVNKERQEGPHPHMIIQLPGSNLVFVPDLGIDKVMIYYLEETGNLSPANTPYVEMEPGSGPRHIAFHPNGRFGFVVNELKSTVTSLSIDKEKGEVKVINTQSILPEDFHEFNKSADILATPDGKYLYATNRGHNSVALLAIDQQNGEIKFVKTFDCGGDWPRAFRLSPDGKYLLVANKNSGNIVIFEIDYQTGELNKKSGIGQFKTPQCIRFLH